MADANRLKSVRAAYRLEHRFARQVSLPVADRLGWACRGNSRPPAPTVGFGARMWLTLKPSGTWNNKAGSGAYRAHARTDGRSGGWGDNAHNRCPGRHGWTLRTLAARRRSDGDSV